MWSLLIQSRGDSTAASCFDRVITSPATLQWVAAVMLLGVTVVLLIGMLVSARSESPSVESHWGGFGGGLGGWRISPSLAFLLGAIAFGAMFTTVVRTMADPDVRATREAPKPAAADSALPIKTTSEPPASTPAQPRGKAAARDSASARTNKE